MLVLCCDNLQASHTHDAIAEAAQLMKEAVEDIMVTLNEAASEVGMVGGMVDSIAEAMAKVSAALRHDDPNSRDRNRTVIGDGKKFTLCVVFSG